MNMPQLYSSRNDDGKTCWILYAEEGPISVRLEIRYYFGDRDGNPNHYRAYACHDNERRNAHSHGYREIITHDEIQHRYDNILMHENKKCADEWLRKVPDNFYVLGKHNRIHKLIANLKQVWENLCRVVSPSINHD